MADKEIIPITSFYPYHQFLYLHSKCGLHYENRRELSASDSSQRRPGDVFHPIFADGRPTYIELSVSSTLQPSNVNNASTTADGLAVGHYYLYKNRQTSAR